MTKVALTSPLLLRPRVVVRAWHRTPASRARTLFWTTEPQTDTVLHPLTDSDSPVDIVHYGLARKHKNLRSASGFLKNSLPYVLSSWERKPKLCPTRLATPLKNWQTQLGKPWSQERTNTHKMQSLYPWLFLVKNRRRWATNRYLSGELIFRCRPISPSTQVQVFEDW